MQNVSIPQGLAQAIHDYLMTRPMREVEGLVAPLRQAQPIKDTPDDRGKPTGEVQECVDEHNA